MDINAYDHRQFLDPFHTGQFPGSFARGVPFQHNPTTGDMRISGTLASLAGLEQALDAHNEDWKEMSIRRILLLHAETLSIGGIPLLYLGEEWDVLNDYDFVRMELVPLDNEHVPGFVRARDGSRITTLANFADTP